MCLVLQDSNFQQGVTKYYHEQCAAYMDAVDHLQRQFEKGELEIEHLRSYHPRAQVESPVWYEVTSYGEKRGYKVVNACRFFSSHYIGRYAYGGYAILLNPRFGRIFNYLISYATNIYIPYGGSEIAYHSQSNSYWLIALLWKAMLNQALTTGQIPKGYQILSKNQNSFRGRLSLAKHIHHNLCDATKFYCTYKKLSMDNAINRTIRTTYGILKGKGLSALVGEFEAYDKYLCSMGVTADVSDVHEIDHIRYTRLSAPYQPVMHLCRTILANHKAESSHGAGANSEISYFIDIADLWEMYLLKLLQNHLPLDYHVYSPNATFGENLLDEAMREIRPDIIIEKDNRVLMIIDAKYKDYSCVGRTSAHGVRREDLYQMTTYLYHYGNEEREIVGIFTSPVAGTANDLHSYAHHKRHRVGLVNLNIVDADDNLEKLHKHEEAYVHQIKQILAQMEG